MKFYKDPIICAWFGWCLGAGMMWLVAWVLLHGRVCQ